MAVGNQLWPEPYVACKKELHGEVLYKNSTVPSKRRIKKAYLVMQDPDYQLFTDSVYQELLLALSDQKDKDEKE